MGRGEGLGVRVAASAATRTRKPWNMGPCYPKPKYPSIIMGGIFFNTVNTRALLWGGNHPKPKVWGVLGFRDSRGRIRGRADP